jgi:hypothetical protein
MILVGDLHLTTSPRDKYRWRIFSQLAKHRGQAKRLVLLGDLTDAKDNHPAELVNRICDELTELRRGFEIHIIRGNHDGVDPEWPYFRFLRELSGVYFYDRPGGMHGLPKILILPHSRNPERDWARLDFRKEGYDTVFAHVTVRGAASESGIGLEGVDPGFFRHVQCYSGDVHVPQKVGNVTYVGAPYPIRFGDRFSPRLLHLQRNKSKHRWEETEIPLKSVRRLMLDIADERDLEGVRLKLGDQIKIRLHLIAEELGDWLRQRNSILKRLRGFDVVSIEVLRSEPRGRRKLHVREEYMPAADEILQEYLDKHRVKTPFADLGRKILRAVLAGKG